MCIDRLGRAVNRLGDFSARHALANHPKDLLLARRKGLQLAGGLVDFGDGAFALDEDGQMVLYRDTLQLANLDANEVQGTIEALSLALAEFGDELIAFSHR